MLVYQYLSMNNELQTIQNIVSRNDKRNVKTILDLEDSLEIPGAHAQSKASRVIAREKLHQLMSGFAPETLMGIRINHIHGEEFSKDLHCLQQCPIQLDHIVLPKVNTADELQAYADALQHASCKEFIVLLETASGLQQLSSILATASSLQISKIHFGHWDYFLSCGAYPLPNQEHTTFWDTVKPLMKTIESGGFTYIHPPVNRLTDYSLLTSVIQYLQSLSSLEFGISTLTNGQSKNAQKVTGSNSALQVQELPVSDALLHAQQLIEQYQSNNYSFSITDDNVFIPPHEYLAAKQYVAACSNK